MLDYLEAVHTDISWVCHCPDTSSHVVLSLSICPVNIKFLFGFKVDFVSMAPTDEHLPSLPAEILVTFSWRDVKGGVFIRYWMGSLTPELWVRTWACRISLDAEWWEESEKSYDDICRISKSLTNREYRSNGLARSRNRTTTVNFWFLTIRYGIWHTIVLQNVPSDWMKAGKSN